MLRLVSFLTVLLVTTLFAVPTFAQADEASATSERTKKEAPKAATANPKNLGKSGVTANYTLRPTDLLRVEVFQEEDLKKEVRVTADGTVILPLIGQVKVGGMTLTAAQKLIQELYAKDYLVDPQVTVLIMQYAERRVHVHGQVNNPGWVLIPAEEEMTLSQAVAGAKGTTLRSNPRAIKLKRTLPNGESLTQEFDLEDILRDSTTKDIKVEDGDSIYVPERIF